MAQQHVHNASVRPAKHKTYGENVRDFPNSLRQAADPRGMPLGGCGAFKKTPQPIAPPQLSASRLPARKQTFTPAQPVRQPEVAQPPKRSVDVRVPGQSAGLRPRTRPQARPVARVVAARRARAATRAVASGPSGSPATRPPAAPVAADARPVVFHPAPLPQPLRPPVTRALAQPPVDPQARQAEALVAAGRNAARARTEAQVDVGDCGFLRKVVSRTPGVLLATFDLACAAVATVATFGYANQVLAVTWRNLKDAMGDPLAPPRADAVAPTPSTAGEPGSRADPANMSRAERLVHRLHNAREKLKVADQEAKVKSAALWGYRRRLAVLGAGTIGLGIAVATTVLSGGATLAIPGLVMATLLVRNYVANARCARANHLAAQQGRPQLPMGNSALNNALYRHYMDSGRCDDAKARWQAAKVGGSVSTAINLALVGLCATTVIAGAAVVRAATWICNGMKGTRLVTSATQGVLVPGFEVLRGRRDRHEQDQRRAEATQAASPAWKEFLEETLRPKAGANDGDRHQMLVADLSNRLAIWSVQSKKLDDLPDFLGKDAWLAGVESAGPNQVGKQASALVQAEGAVRELRLKEQAAEVGDMAGAVGVGFSQLTWTGSLASFAQDLA